MGLGSICRKCHSALLCPGSSCCTRLGGAGHGVGELPHLPPSPGGQAGQPGARWCAPSPGRAVRPQRCREMPAHLRESHRCTNGPQPCSSPATNSLWDTGQVSSSLCSSCLQRKGSGRWSEMSPLACLLHLTFEALQALQAPLRPVYCQGNVSPGAAMALCQIPLIRATAHTSAPVLHSAWSTLLLQLLVQGPLLQNTSLTTQPRHCPISEPDTIHESPQHLEQTVTSVPALPSPQEYCLASVAQCFLLCTWSAGKSPRKSSPPAMGR